MFWSRQRGSMFCPFRNDRLVEPETDRSNAERLFDSQNNPKGGYSWGPKMYYYVGSSLSIEWTSQHSCGQENTDCDIVLQYMCDPLLRDGSSAAPENANQPNTPSYCDPQNPAAGCNKTEFTAVNNAGELKYGLHESYDYYDKCYCRERNKGLFAADRNIDNTRGATSTRQNTNGNNVRNTPSENGNANHGYECPEERDYWPYWHPTPWRDIAVMTTRTSECATMVGTSQNTNAVGQCIFPNNVNYPVNANGQRLAGQGANNPAACIKQSGTWVDTPPNGDGAPECLPAQHTRDNHLGNAAGLGYTAGYNWTIPNRPSQSCVLRLRYNITTKDGGKTFSSLRSGDNGVKSPVTQDPILFHSFNMPQNPTAYTLKLALDTAQTGRTFQDRSHSFEIRARPGGVDGSRRIFNLNVRGKRGNIVQTYPATEYDFVPQALNVKTGDYIHLQWVRIGFGLIETFLIFLFFLQTGSQDGAYPNGQDGEGTDKTDRHNMVGLVAGQKGGNYFYALNDTQGVAQPFSQEVHNAIAWIGQTACNESAVLQQIATATNTSEQIRVLFVHTSHLVLLCQMSISSRPIAASSTACRRRTLTEGWWW